MLSPSWRRTALALGLLALAAPALATAPTKAGRSRPVHLLEWLTPLWAAIGCSLDPHGACLPAGEKLDIGCSFDPSGMCSPFPARPDIGCRLDPSGGCLPSSL